MSTSSTAWSLKTSDGEQLQLETNQVVITEDGKKISVESIAPGSTVKLWNRSRTHRVATTYSGTSDIGAKNWLSVTSDDAGNLTTQEPAGP